MLSVTMLCAHAKASSHDNNASVQQVPVPEQSRGQVKDGRLKSERVSLHIPIFANPPPFDIMQGFQVLEQLFTATKPLCPYQESVS